MRILPSYHCLVDDELILLLEHKLHVDPIDHATVSSKVAVADKCIRKYYTTP